MNKEFVKMLVFFWFLNNIFIIHKVIFEAIPNWQSGTFLFNCFNNVVIIEFIRNKPLHVLPSLINKAKLVFRLSSCC